MNPQDQRIARTESLFRDVNERIAESAERFDSPGAEFVCECADQACTDRIEATLEEYEKVRSDGAHFLLSPGHEDTRVERVVLQRGKRHSVVEKFNAAIVDLVRRWNPRVQGA